MFLKKRNGKGISYYESGNKEYEGYWKNNVKKGKGKLFDDSESNFLVYEGDFSKNKINGNGTHFYKNGKKDMKENLLIIFIKEWENIIQKKKY